MRAPDARGPLGPGLQWSFWDLAVQAEDLARLGSVAVAPVDGAETAANDDLSVGDAGIGDVHGVHGQWRVVWQASERALSGGHWTSCVSGLFSVSPDVQRRGACRGCKPLTESQRRLL